jgi:uncharacterized damage-inducible protein DinB
MGRKSDFQEIWAWNAALLQQILEAMGEEGLTANYAPRARNVRRIAVHIHNMRLHWLGALADEVHAIPRLKGREAHTVAELTAALEASSKAVETWLVQIAHRKKVKVFDRSPMAMLSFMVAHEAHHRGQIIIALRLAGRPLDRAVIDQLWDWT